jgi:hypothetical protein
MDYEDKNWFKLDILWNLRKFADSNHGLEKSLSLWRASAGRHSMEVFFLLSANLRKFQDMRQTTACDCSCSYFSRISLLISHVVSYRQNGTYRPLLPDQHTFHEHLRALARSAVRVVIEEVMREELEQFLGAAWGESVRRIGSYEIPA